HPQERPPNPPCDCFVVLPGSHAYPLPSPPPVTVRVFGRSTTIQTAVEDHGPPPAGMKRHVFHVDDAAGRVVGGATVSIMTDLFEPPVDTLATVTTDAHGDATAFLACDKSPEGSVQIAWQAGGAPGFVALRLVPISCGAAVRT